MTALATLLALALLPAQSPQQPSRYPPPELGPDYVEPATAFPPLRDLVPPLLDVAILVAALAVATWLGHRWRRRTALWFLTLASVAWFGFVRAGCVCPVGSLQNVAEALADSSAPLLPATALFFVVPLITALFYGRTFCGSVCPLGAVQELVLVKPLSIPAPLAAGLALLPLVYLHLAVLFAVTDSGFLICRYDPFVGFFRMGATVNILVVGGALLLISAFVGRPYCRFLCPYGVLLGWAAKLSRRRITIAPTACTNCRLCEGTCPYGAITEPNVATLGGERFRGRRTLATVLLLAPLLVVGLGAAAAGLGPALARGNPRVALAEQVAAEDAGLLRETTDASDVFRASGESVASLNAKADALRSDFVLGGWIGGGLIGLVIALRLIGLSVRRTRRDYQADRELCLACGRCFEWCPVEHERRGTTAEGSVRR
ncbi:MAG: 4Fe-4S binding protein [Planctomycetes bacterium]|nr:4Fe-4S binding protein [Planctomycetota bacterium]